MTRVAGSVALPASPLFVTVGRIARLAGLAAALLGSTAAAWANLELAGARFPSALHVGHATLFPTSCGVRDTLWIDHYAAALYLPRSLNPTAAADPTQPAAVVLRMIETRYMPDHIPDKWLTALESAVQAPQLAAIRKAYRAFKDGDRVTIRYTPAAGVTLHVNGRAVAKLRGHAAVDAMLHAWAGGEAVQAKLARLAVDHPCS